MNEARATVLTIGHSTHALEAFIALLQRHHVTAVADVRAAPYSRFNPQFNRQPLAAALGERGIEYVFLGRELGGRSGDPSCYENGRIRYARLARTERFGNGIDRVMRGTRRYRIALMCAEKEPLDCHRTLLVARALDERGVDVAHILAGGTLEPHTEAMDRLLDKNKEKLELCRNGFFPSKREELIALAIDSQEARVAYKRVAHKDDQPAARTAEQDS